MSDRLVEDIEALAALFRAGGWDELRVTFGGVSVLLSNDPATPALGSAVTAAVAGPVAPPPPPPPPAPPPSPLPAKRAAADPGWVPVVAPNLGTFYRAPKPGARPFVEIGQRVDAATELCLLEVMKLFTSVTAGIAGTVRRIDVADGQLVEGGQVLFHIEPARP